ncbi:pyridoxamine 5'-phosphate oxidase family protein [Methanomethylovorans sp.]|uniref:pyridoxamine 5'-phosphate oxidase family protein n=1 Tax=Methanomethylovorans sp. TaxID=2758717 RepID=UPI000A52849F|nr:pyridoxamine 5'-phosphate oxidase family protein [Methanomethylovorans sp.]
MQDRMKHHQLQDEQIKEILLKAPVGNIATINENGYPYVVPVHFIYYGDKIYIHGLPVGQKISNILSNEKVCFQIHDMKGLILNSSPCEINTEYESIVMTGTAMIVEDHDLKKIILNKIVEKYTPHLNGASLSDNMVKGTGVIEVTISELTGKYYK